MSTTLSPPLVGVLAGAVVAIAGVGAYLQTALGGPGTLGFVVRLLLVSLAVLGALLLGLAIRSRRERDEASIPDAPR